MNLGLLVTVAITQYFFATINCKENFIDDYCWRDYVGIMPKDGLKAGKDRSGRPIYIGQALFQDKLIPGKIHENEKLVHFEFSRAHVANESLKILCTNNPGRFEWIPIKISQVLHGIGRHFFTGGFEKDFETFVGRAMSHGELTVGKVVCNRHECYRLSTIENGSWYGHDNFEILAYNPDVLPTEPDPTNQTFTPFLFLFVMLVSILIGLFLIIRMC